MGKTLAEVKSSNGILVIGEKAVKLQRRGRAAFVSGGRSDKIIPYKNITGVQLKRAGMRGAGYLQLTVIGGSAPKKRLVRDPALEDDNVIAFSRNNKFSEWQEAHDYILGRITE